MRARSRPRKNALINGLLLMGLVGVLITYLIVVSGDIPSHVYTPAQYAYLNYNRGRVISQESPTWSFVLPDGQKEQVAAAALAEWRTRVRATLDARYEQQNSIILTVYDLDFHSEYHLTYAGPAITTTVELFFPFPNNLETLHDVRFRVDGAEPPEAQYSLSGISWKTEMHANEGHQIAIDYQADGVNSFAYSLNQGRRSEILDVSISVSGLSGSAVPEASLPTTENTKDAETGHETFAWNYTNLIPSRDIQVDLPTRLGFAQRVEQLQDDFRVLAGLAPFLVGLFLASLAGLLLLSGIRLPVTGYLLAGFGLALFYPLLTFLSGLINVSLAATISLLLVSSLLLLFLGLTVGWRWAAWRVGLLLAIFLGAFSLGMLTPWWRLLVTGGAFALLGFFMLQYARRPIPPAPEPSAAPLLAKEPAKEPIKEPEEGQQPTPTLPPEPALQQPDPRHCPHCGRALADDHNFCPGCGHDASPFHRCANCGQSQYVSSEVEAPHCVHCGSLLQIR
jgi:hypothetical protein